MRGVQVDHQRDARGAVSRVVVSFGQLPGAAQSTEAKLDSYRPLHAEALPAVDEYSTSDATLSFRLGDHATFFPLADHAGSHAADAAVLVRQLVAALETLHGVQLRALYLDPALVFVSEGFENVALVPPLWLAPPLGQQPSELPGAAPELFREDGTAGTIGTIGPAADVYALGTLLWYVLAGTPRDPNEDRLFPDACPHVPDAKAWDVLLDGCLRSNPARRLQLSEIVDQLPHPPAMRAETPVAGSGDAPSPEARAGGSRRTLKIAALAAVLTVVVVTSIALIGSVGAGGGSARGFANTVVRYADRSYDESGWAQVKAVSAVSRAAQGAFGPLYAIDGVDAENFWIGDEAGRLFRVKAGHWEYAGAPPGSAWPRISALDGDTAFVASQKNPGKPRFSIVAPEGTRGFDIEGYQRAWPTIIAADFVWLSTIDYWGTPHAYRLQGDAFAELTPDKEVHALVHGEDNAPLADFHSGFLIEPATFSAQRTSYALWANASYELKPMIVRFEEGRWVTVEEVETEFNTWGHKGINAVWFGRDEGVFVVIVGDAGKVVLHRIGGASLEQTITASESTTSMRLIAVWGVSSERYWVMDSNGSVWERRANQWRLVVRGLYDDDESFRAAWVAPGGSVFALTEDHLYRLD